MMPNSQMESTQGLLDLAVELSKNDITAGNEFTIFVLVKNPFNKPVWIQEVNVSLPSDLLRLDDRESQQTAKDAEKKQQLATQERKQELEQLKESINGLDKNVVDLISQIKNKPEVNFSGELFGLEHEISRLGKRLNELETGESSINISGSAEIRQIKIASQLSSINLDSDANNRDEQTDRRNKIFVEQIEVYEPWLVHEQQTLSRTVSLKSSLPANTALLPGSTAVYSAILNVKRSLIFTPTKYRLQFYVNYSFETKEESSDKPLSDSIFTNTIAHHISIRPSVYSVIIGSALGGIFGAVARLLQSPTTPSLSSITVSLILSIILGGIAIIFMSRKSDTQSFVSVEDFWGGILIGFLVGYSGVSFFEGITGVTAPK